MLAKKMSMYGFVRFAYGYGRLLLNCHVRFCTVLYGFVRFTYGYGRLLLNCHVRLCTVHVRSMYGPCTVNVRPMYGPCTGMYGFVWLM